MACRAEVLARTDFVSADARDLAIGMAVTESGAELALLAGYDQLLRRPYFSAFGGRTINIHPSLLPRHGGRGMVGLAVHRAVLAAGDSVSGVTVHEVTEAVDAGPPIAQVEVPVLPGDSCGGACRTGAGRGASDPGGGARPPGGRGLCTGGIW